MVKKFLYRQFDASAEPLGQLESSVNSQEEKLSIIKDEVESSYC